MHFANDQFNSLLNKYLILRSGIISLDEDSN